MSGQENTDRRTVLKAVASSAALTGVATGSASASSSAVPEESRAKIVNQYNSATAVQQLAQEEAESVVRHLKRNGYIDKLPENEPSDIREASESDQSVVDVVQPSQDAHPRVLFRLSGEEHDISIHVNGDQQDSYAIVRPQDESQPFAIRENLDGVETDDLCEQSGVICCGWGCGCGDLSVGKYERIVCRSGECYQGDYLGCGLAAFTDCKTC